MKEVLKILKVRTINKTAIIGAKIFAELPECCMIVPYSSKCYVILLQENKDQIPESIVISRTTQKPNIFLVQPIAENLEITFPEKERKNLPYFMMKDEFVDYVKKKYNVCREEMIQNIGKKIINSLMDFVSLEPH